jgi:hypothetical protein
MMGKKISMNGFGDTAQKLSRNPLGIIALFIVLIYGIACLTFSFSKNIPVDFLRWFCWFIIVYPLIVLAIFFILVTKHHTKLYAPRDFQRPEDFLECAYGDQNRRITKIGMIIEESKTPHTISLQGIESGEKFGTPALKEKKPGE